MYRLLVDVFNKWCLRNIVTAMNTYFGIMKKKIRIIFCETK